MPTFTMCDDPECPQRDSCRRHPDSGTEPDDPQEQEWFPVSPREDDGCSEYWTVPKDAA